MTFAGGIFGLVFSSGEKLTINDFNVVKSKILLIPNEVWRKVFERLIVNHNIKISDSNRMLFQDLRIDDMVDIFRKLGIDNNMELTIVDPKIDNLDVAISELYRSRILLQDLGIDTDDIFRKIYLRQFLFVPRGNGVWFSIVVSFIVLALSFV